MEEIPQPTQKELLEARLVMMANQYNRIKKQLENEQTN
jgi:hypothetical protein